MLRLLCQMLGHACDDDDGNFFTVLFGIMSTLGL